VELYLLTFGGHKVASSNTLDMVNKRIADTLKIHKWFVSSCIELCNRFQPYPRWTPPLHWLLISQKLKPGVAQREYFRFQQLLIGYLGLAKYFFDRQCLVWEDNKRFLCSWDDVPVRYFSNNPKPAGI